MARYPKWSPDEDSFLECHYACHTNRELSVMMASMGWSRAPHSIASRACHLGVRKAQFPWNKGKSGYHQLKPSRLHKPSHNAKGLLDEFVRKSDGRTFIKVCPRGAEQSYQDWLDEGKYVWMQANGRDWPEGHYCYYADGDASNLDPENIVAVPPEVNMFVSGANRAAIPWWDRETLEVAIADAMLASERYRAERGHRG